MARIANGAQRERVFNLMQDGQKRTLADIRENTGDPEASISARLRDFRKAKFGGHEVRCTSEGAGVRNYQLIIAGGELAEV